MVRGDFLVRDCLELLRFKGDCLELLRFKARDLIKLDEVPNISDEGDYITSGRRRRTNG